MINTLSDLQKLFRVCRRQGVTEIKLGDVEIKFGDLPNETTNISSAINNSVSDPFAGFPDVELTPEQLMFYSSGGVPSDDPTLKDESQ